MQILKNNKICGIALILVQNLKNETLTFVFSSNNAPKREKLMIIEFSNNLSF